MGTPLPDEYRKPNGEPYLSGTEYAFEDAVRPDTRCNVLVYRRTERVMIDLDDPDRSEKIEKYQRVKQFFQRLQNAHRAFMTYESPSEFSRRLETDIKTLLDNDRPQARDNQGNNLAIRDRLDDAVAPLWQGSPYPGLRPFRKEESKIFFGRGMR